MSYDLFRKRMTVKGVASESIRTATINRVNSSFENSPYYKVVQVDNIPTECRVVQKELDKGDPKVLLLKPDNANVRGGSVAVIDGLYWLVLELYGSDIFKKAKVSRCNSSIVVNGSTFPCIVSNIMLDMRVGSENLLSSPDGMATLRVQHNMDTDTVSIGDLFNLGGVRYSVKGIDRLSLEGVLGLILEAVTNEAPANVDAPSTGGGTGW